MHSWLQDAIAENAEIVTSSRRLARELRSCYDDSQVAAGRQAWLTPTVHPLAIWLGSKFDLVAQDAVLPTRLDPASAAFVWERCLRQELTEPCLSIGGLVRQTFRAWQLAAEWSVSTDELAVSASSQDEKLFARTAIAYEAELTKKNWIDDAILPRAMTDLISSKSISLGSRIYFAGYDRFTPAVTNVIKALRSAGTEVVVPKSDLCPESTTVTEYPEPSGELRAAGAWARGKLLENPKLKIAIIIGALESDADQAYRLVLEGLAPGWQLGGPEHRAAANVSYGRNLSEYHSIAIALLVLRWVTDGLTGREISQLLRTRSIGDGVVSERCKLEHSLRQVPDRQWSPGQFLQFFDTRKTDGDLGAFFDGLRMLAGLADQRDLVGGPAAWASKINDWLSDLAWPGKQALDSAEFQLLNRWRQLLNEFAKTEFVVSEMRLEDAVKALASLARETIFQPEVAENAVQIIGPLEAAGIEFDAVRIIGMDSEQWPSQGRPSPFLSRALQKKYGMPDATAQDTLEFRRRVLHRLHRSSPDCSFSWSSVREDAEQSISPLLEDICPIDCETGKDPGWFALQSVSHDGVEIVDDVVPSVLSDERVFGGAYTLQRQSVEPFSAFAYGRLGVRNPNPFQPGLSHRLRGNIVHDALHNLFAERPDQKAIQSWTEQQRMQRFGSAVDSALSVYTRHADETLQSILRIERTRLLVLLQNFIESEQVRGCFSVENVESELTYERSGVRLDLRVDRIDRLDDGSLLIIDYKTGAPKNFVRRDGTPAELQLVVYADAIDANVGGLSLINIDSREITYKGSGASIEWCKNDAELWDEHLNEWRSIVHALISEFASGDVRVNQKLSSAEARPLRILARRGAAQYVD